MGSLGLLPKLEGSPLSSPNVLFFREKKSACTFFSPDRGDCRSRKMLQNAYLDVKIGVDTEENEPSKVDLILVNFSPAQGFNFHMCIPTRYCIRLHVFFFRLLRYQYIIQKYQRVDNLQVDAEKSCRASSRSFFIPDLL